MVDPFRNHTDVISSRMESELRKPSMLGRFVFCALLAGVSGQAAPQPPRLQFNRDIRPILSENCFVCHGPDKNNRKAKLRLDVRDVALEKKAIVPGKPEESELVKRIFNPNEEDVM